MCSETGVGYHLLLVKMYYQVLVTILTGLTSYNTSLRFSFSFYYLIYFLHFGLSVLI